MTVTAGLTAPGNFSATTELEVNSSYVWLQWQVVAGATSYRVERTDQLGHPWDLIAQFAGTSMRDIPSPTRPSPITFLYRVRAVAGEAISAPSALDYATVAMTLFSARPVAQQSLIRGQDLEEVRRAIDAVRVAAGLSNAWTSYTASGLIYAADHVTARQKLKEATDLLGKTISYSSTPTALQPIRAIHITEVQDGVR